MPSDSSVAPPDGHNGLQPIDLSLGGNRATSTKEEEQEEEKEAEQRVPSDEPLDLCVTQRRRHHVGAWRSQRRKRRRLEQMVSHLRKCSASSGAGHEGKGGVEEEEDDDDDDNDDDNERASVRNPLLARTLGLLAVPTWPPYSYRPKTPPPASPANQPKMSSSSSPSSSPSPPQKNPLVASVRKRSQRALTGKHVKQGTGASPSTLLTLRHKIEERQKGQSCHVAIARAMVTKKNGGGVGRKKKPL